MIVTRGWKKYIILEKKLQDILQDSLFLQTVLQDSCKQWIAIASYLPQSSGTLRILASYARFSPVLMFKGVVCSCPKVTPLTKVQ